MGHTYTKKLFVVYLKFRFNWLLVLYLTFLSVGSDPLGDLGWVASRGEWGLHLPA